jgi:serine/threonine protein kinase/TPR repeat protein
VDPAGPEPSLPAEPPAPGGRLIGKRPPREPAPPDPAPPEVGPDRPPSSGALSPSIAWIQGDPAQSGGSDWETPHLGADGRLEQRLPAKVGPYAVLGEIARGGMGIVVRARHEALGRLVALKLLRMVGADDEARARFLLEARTAARLRHPGIVQVHDVVTDPQGRSYLVMDLVEGRSLRAIVDERGRLPAAEAALLVAQVSEAVEHAHAQGVVHRDLKPHNVLIDARTRQPLLTDFGLAKVVAGPEASSDSSTRSHPRPGEAGTPRPASPEAAGLTRSDVVLGTPRYMAPEQIDPSRGRIGPPTDVYGLGGILHECLTGVTPFEGSETNETFLRVLDEAPRALPADVPRGLEAIVLRCLEKSPHARYRTAGDLRRELERFLAGRRTLGEVHVSRRAPGASLLRFALAVGLWGVAGWLVVTRAWPAAREAIAAAGTAAATSRAAPAATEPPPPPPPRPLALPTATPGVAREPRPGLRLAPTPLTTANVERLAAEGYADALLVWGHGRLTGTLGGPADPVEGRRLIERSAEAGLPQALLFLGQALQPHGGSGLPPDPPAARRWLERGAAAGSVECMAALGALLASGGAPEDEAPALRWLEQAAAAKLPQARALLADLLASERPAVRDPARAVALWREDAAAGSAQAMLRLAQAYEVGLQGLRRDPEEARGWYEKARAAGSEEADRRLRGLGR